jgi:hypothetical protein
MHLEATLLVVIGFQRLPLGTMSMLTRSVRTKDTMEKSRITEEIGEFNVEENWALLRARDWKA